MSLLQSIRSTWIRTVSSGQDVTIKFEVPGTAVVAAMVNSTRLSFNGNQAVITLPPGKHTLLWGVEQGQPGATYTIEITSPEGSKWKPATSPKIDPDGMAGGVHVFTVSKP